MISWPKISYWSGLVTKAAPFFLIFLIVDNYD